VWNGKNGRKTAFFSLEMPTYQLMERMVVSDSGIYGGKLRNPNSLDATDWSKTSASISRLCELPVEIIDCIYTVEGIKLRAQQLQLQGQVDLIVVDYLGLCRTSSRVNSRYEEVSIMSRLFKLMAKDLKVPVLLLAQLNRENVKDKRPPMVVDLRDSGTIEQDADVILLMHDPLATTAMESPPAVRTIELAIAKNRHGQAGRTMELEFYTGMQRFASKQG
jgi:replicative DNA helicase